jgi:hypothetical protein
MKDLRVDVRIEETKALLWRNNVDSVIMKT